MPAMIPHSPVWGLKPQKVQFTIIMTICLKSEKLELGTLFIKYILLIWHLINLITPNVVSILYIFPLNSLSKCLSVLFFVDPLSLKKVTEM